jgi:NADH:ubiquinone oxidoreductase subunit 6 (subunit J)
VEAEAVTLALFFVIARWRSRRGCWCSRRGRPATAMRALRVCLVASGCAYVQVMAPVVGVVQVVVLAGAAALALQGLADDRGAEEAKAAGGGGRGPWRLLGGLALVLVSTWARQYVWTGRELAPGSSFGTAAAVGAAWAEAYAPALVAGLLVLMVAAIAGSQAAEHRL